MASEREIFGVTGPSFLTAIDWNNSYHRRSIAASLVQGVYQLEHDRQGPHALANPWWEFFNFKLIQVLVDDHDVSYFGAIFEFKSPRPIPLNSSFQRPPPLYVIAFRGTIDKAINRAQDFKLNLQSVLNNLENSTRFHSGYEAVRGAASRVGSGNIWLAGHSLGASIALTIGREMAITDGDHVETYLFNPPFMSPPIDQLIKNENLRLGLRSANSVVKAGFAIAVYGRQKARETNQFTKLSSWVPYLFINPNDPICSEYIGYFEHREKMESIGAGKIERIATQHSIGSIASAAIGKVCGAVHLIPSAYLSINCGPRRSFIEAHGIQQWWRPDLELKNKFYQYK